MSSEPLNKTETHILAMLEQHGVLSISEISRLISISRQGTQKDDQQSAGRRLRRYCC
ncbi:hypothetical protein ACFTAO_39580 [Paenibacillus rhizoplanae]